MKLAYMLSDTGVIDLRMVSKLTTPTAFMVGTLCILGAAILLEGGSIPAGTMLRVIEHNYAQCYVCFEMLASGDFLDMLPENSEILAAINLGTPQPPLWA